MFEKLFRHCLDFVMFLRRRGFRHRFWCVAVLYIPRQLWNIEVFFKYGSWAAWCQAYDDQRLKERRDAARSAGLL